MAPEKKVVRGGFRATLALIVSIIALIIALIAWDRSREKGELHSRVLELQKRIEVMKKETAQKIDRIREESAKALERLSQGLKKEKEGQ